MNDIRGIYKHFKGGLYEVYGVCSSKNTGQIFVLYKPLYNETGFWIRLYSMFFSKVSYDKMDRNRFEIVNAVDNMINEKELTVLNSETYDVYIIKKENDEFILSE